MPPRIQPPAFPGPARWRAGLLALSMLLVVVASSRGAQEPPRGTLRLAEAPARAASDDTVTVAGRATVASGMMHGRALDIAIHDGTGGIWVYKRHAGNVRVQVGDSVVATGVIKRYRGALEVDASHVRVVPADRRVPPVVVLPGVLVRPVDEGSLVRMRGIAGASGRSEGGWWRVVHSAPGAAKRDSITIWVAAAHESPPDMERIRTGDEVEVTGILSSYQNNPTDARVWQVMPRGPRDLVLHGVPGNLREWVRVSLATLAVALIVGITISRVLARREQRALREVEARYQQLLALSPDAVLVHANGTIAFANPAAARLLGVADAATLVAQPIARYWPEGAAATEAPARTRLVTASGESVDVEAAANPCRFHDRPATMVLARDVRAQLRHERELRALAQLDELTGLFNRRGFQLHAETMRREHASAGRPLALVLADLDRLKAINDTHGHAAGDAAIRAVAEALRATLGDDALVARWGGDEFAALVALGEAGEEAAQALGDRVQRELSSVAVSVGDQSIEAAASVGAAALPAVGVSATAETLALADSRLYARKRERRGAGV